MNLATAKTRGKSARYTPVPPVAVFRGLSGSLRGKGCRASWLEHNFMLSKLFDLELSFALSVRPNCFRYVAEALTFQAEPVITGLKCRTGTPRALLPANCKV